MLCFGVVFMLLAIASAAHCFSFGLPSILPWNTAIAASAAGSFATVAAIFFGLYQFRHQDDVQRSQFALALAKEGVEHACQVLASDKPTRRMAWVNAARLLLRAEATAGSIRETDHLASWGLHREEWRIRLLPFLRCSHRFYFGLGDFNECGTSVSIDQDEMQGLFAESAFTSSFSAPGLSWEGDSHTRVQEHVVRVIFNFVSSSTDPQDPLAGSEGFSESELEKLGERDLWGVLGYVKALQAGESEPEKK